MLNEDRAIQSPRMRRKLFNLATAISLVIFLLAIGIWVRSYWISDVVTWNSTHTDPSRQPATRWNLGYQLASSCGTVEMFRIRQEFSGAFLKAPWGSGATYHAEPAKRA